MVHAPQAHTANVQPSQNEKQNKTKNIKKKEKLPKTNIPTAHNITHIYNTCSIFPHSVHRNTDTTFLFVCVPSHSPCFVTDLNFKWEFEYNHFNFMPLSN